eukprot:IDg6190t1
MRIQRFVNISSSARRSSCRSKSGATGSKCACSSALGKSVGC